MCIVVWRGGEDSMSSCPVLSVRLRKCSCGGPLISRSRTGASAVTLMGVRGSKSNRIAWINECIEQGTVDCALFVAMRCDGDGEG